MAEIRYRVYIGTVLVLSSLAILAVIFGSFALSLQDRLFEETQDRLRATAVLGAEGIDTRDLTALLGRMGSPLAENEVRAVESTPEFARISAYLNKIRSTNQTLILYVYILAPGVSSVEARFVVDADTLKLRALESSSADGLDEKISAFNDAYDISAQPETMAALMQRSPQVGSKFIHDEEYGTNSLMGFAPIFDRETGAFLACIGIDISDKNYSAFLYASFLPAIIAALLLLIVIAAGSWLLAWKISEPIIQLTVAVRRFGDADLSSRAGLKTFIKELYDLKCNFNGMADKIQNYQEHLIALNSSMERFVPDAFLSFLSKKSILEVRLGDQIQKDMTIMFSDIRGFTAISEHLTPKQTFNFLNDYLSRIAPIIRQNGGFIDKYLGDGIMAIFPSRVDDAVRCALGMVQEIRKLNVEREKEGLSPVATGTGIHCGTMMMGTIGEERRMQTTVIADSVNLAARLETMTKDVGSRLLISRDVYNRLEDSESFLTRYIGSITFKGKEERVGVFEVFDQDDATVREMKAASKQSFERAVSLITSKDLSGASSLLRDILEKNPDDGAARWALSLARDECPTATSSS